jgi:hypothetical protein
LGEQIPLNLTETPELRAALLFLIFYAQPEAQPVRLALAAAVMPMVERQLPITIHFYFLF